MLSSLFLIPVLGAAALGCIWRAMTMMKLWRPAAAVVWQTDDPAGGWDGGADLGYRGWLGQGRALRAWRARMVGEMVHYEDAEGDRRVAQVSRWVGRGQVRDGGQLIWYEIADPGNARAYGPGTWLLYALAILAAGAALMALSLRLPR